MWKKDLQKLSVWVLVREGYQQGITVKVNTVMSKYRHFTLTLVKSSKKRKHR